MMKHSLLFAALLLTVSCMKSRDEYQEAISEVREDQEAEGVIQKEEETPNPDRARGSNDAEGMGMDE